MAAVDASITITLIPTATNPAVMPNSACFSRAILRMTGAFPQSHCNKYKWHCQGLRVPDYPAYGIAGATVIVNISRMSKGAKIVFTYKATAIGNGVPRKLLCKRDLVSDTGVSRGDPTTMLM